MGSRFVVTMSFASPRGTPRTDYSPRATPRTTEFCTTASPGTYLWPSETDPSRAHWLRNEVIGFERVLVVLRTEHENLIALLATEEADREKADAIEAEIRRTVDELEQKRAELEAENVRQLEQIALIQVQADDAEQARELLLTSNNALTARLAVLEHETKGSKEQVALQQSLQLQLQRSCVSSQADLQALRDHPQVPEEYAQMVAATEEHNKARIEQLQAELERLIPQEESVVERNNELTEGLRNSKNDQAKAEQAVLQARDRAEQQKDTKLVMEAELDVLQERYYLSPAKVE